MRRVSKKKARLRGMRALAVDLVLERDEHCKGLDLIPGHVCWGGLTGHEPLKRSAGGDPNNPDEVVAICWGLNSAIETDPEIAQLARQCGLTVSMSSRYSNGRLIRRDF